MGTVNTNLSSQTRRWQTPSLSLDDRWIGGVAAAIAVELGVQPLIIRISFAILALAGGWGLVFYAICWGALNFLSPPRFGAYIPVPKAASSFHRHIAIAMVVLGVVLGLRSLGFGFVDEIVFPAGFVLTGFLIAWSRQQEEGGVSAVIRIVIGVVVAAAGLFSVVLSSLQFVDAVRLLVVAVAVVGGIALVVAPSVVRIGQDFDLERQERVRADERARVAAHLHDSVLQTLTLIQRNAHDPQRTAQIARQQERELRSWLYGNEPSQPGTTRLEPALQQVAARVEQDHGVKVEVVTVGDTHDIDPGSIQGLVAATQEAATNAAKHAQVAKIDVYAERRPESIEVFVRDAGIGFDADNIKDDRQGIRRSIIDRMERHGGSASIWSEVGAGTEVELIQPLGKSAPNSQMFNESFEQPPSDRPAADSATGETK
ncbi:MAG: ATP-binding protein [Acidimicrobiales bacterium]